MRKAITITILFIVTFANVVLSQDNSTLAQDAYLKAEAYVLQNENSNALKQLANAEKYLGATNSKILYLKISILKSQFSTNSDNYPMLKSSIAEFFSITNKDNYPSDKYLEMVRVKSDLNDFVEKDSVESNRLINNGNLDDITNYVHATPNTLYYTKLGQKKRSLGGQGEVNRKVDMGIMPDFASSNDIGLKVDGVKKDGLADNGGILKGDIIIAINGKTIKNIYDYMDSLKTLRGNTIYMDILRDGKQLMLSIQL